MSVNDDRNLPIFIHSEIDDAGLDPYAFRLYARYARRAGNKQGECRESQSNMAQGLHMTRKRLKKAQETLIERGMVRVKKRHGKTDIVTLTGRSAWTLGEKTQGDSTQGENTQGGTAKSPDPPRAKSPDKGTPSEGTPSKGENTAPAREAGSEEKNPPPTSSQNPTDAAGSQARSGQASTRGAGGSRNSPPPPDSRMKESGEKGSAAVTSNNSSPFGRRPAPPDHPLDYFPSLDHIIEIGGKAGVLPEVCEMFYHHFNQQGWVRSNGRPIVQFDSALAVWKVKQPQFSDKKSGDDSILPEKGKAYKLEQVQSYVRQGIPREHFKKFSNADDRFNANYKYQPNPIR